MENQVKEWLKKLKENEQAISMLMGGLVVLVVGYLLVTYFRRTPEPVVFETPEATESATYTLTLAEDETGEVVPAGLPTTHRVVTGENLWKISEKYYGSGYNWVDIAEVNELGNTEVITEDQQLTIPKLRVRVPLDGGLAVNVVESELEMAKTGASDTYVVARGDSLWSIAQSELGDGFGWTQIYEMNRELIDNPSIIEVGWELRLPVE